MDYRPGQEALEDQTPSRMNAKTCHVCGVVLPQFTEPSALNNHGRWKRRDVKTCGATCRKRLQRGTPARNFKKRP